MRAHSSATLVLGSLMVGCGVVAGHQNHRHREKQIPLHEQEYIQDPVEELERKWSFEVSSESSYCLLRFQRHQSESRWRKYLLIEYLFLNA
jgi:hypothetical protein